MDRYELDIPVLDCLISPEWKLYIQLSVGWFRVYFAGKKNFQQKDLSGHPKSPFDRLHAQEIRYTIYLTY